MGKPTGIVLQKGGVWGLRERFGVGSFGGGEKLLTAEVAEETRRTAILLERLTLRTTVLEQDNNKSKINGDGQECLSHTFAHLLGEEVVEGFYGGEFVVFDVENGVKLGDVEDVVNFLGEVEELEFASGVADGGEAGN